MKPAKHLHIRIPADLHQQLVKYADERFISVSAVVLQTLAKAIDYKPRPSTSRSEELPKPQYWDGTKFVSHPKGGSVDDEGNVYEEWTLPEEDDPEMAELRRRAASAPLRPVR